MRKNYIFFLFSIFFLPAFSMNASEGKIMVNETSSKSNKISSLSFTGGTSLVVSLSSTVETCTAADGTATASLSGSGGTGIISYAWSNGNSGSTITNLPAGTYSVTASDEAGCMGISSISVNQSSVILNVTTMVTDEICTANDGTATASATGGTAVYSYSWSNSGSTALISGLTADTYTVTATDANGCMGTANAVVNQNVITLSPSISVTDAICTADNGTAMVSVTGGTGAYSYGWSTSGSTAMLSGLSPASYSVTVTDGNGCQGTTSAIVGQENISLSLTGSSTLSSGTDGTATASATGGTAAYDYSWDNGGMTATITGLVPATYGVTATDVNGCEGNTSVVVEAVLPIELLSFSGSYDKGIVNLSWSTALEINNKGFYIEKYSSGNDWKAIGFVEGSGTTEIQQGYRFTDKEPYLDKSFYRLKQVDFDGSFEYSNVISISVVREFTDLLLFPNPNSGDAINLQFVSQKEGDLQIEILNQIGQRIFAKDYITESGTNNLRLSISDFLAGLYFIKVTSDKNLIIKEFIVE